MKRELITTVLADGCARDRQSLRMILEEGGYGVVGEAADGVALIQLCEAVRPHVVFLDIGLPYLDGLSAGAYLREQKLAGLIFFLGETAEESLVTAARNLGAGGFLVKPVTGKKLLPSLAAALARQENMDAMRESCAEIERQIDEHRMLERAKCAVMERERIGAEEAMGFLNRVAEEKKLPLLKLAKLFAARAENTTT